MTDKSLKWWGKIQGSMLTKMNDRILAEEIMKKNDQEQRIQRMENEIKMLKAKVAILSNDLASNFYPELNENERELLHRHIKAEGGHCILTLANGGGFDLLGALMRLLKAAKIFYA